MFYQYGMEDEEITQNKQKFNCLSNEQVTENHCN